MRLPFLPKRYSKATEFEAFIVHAKSGTGGAKGNMEIPVPAGATAIRGFRIAGVDNGGTITVTLYRSGWNTSGNTHATFILLNTTISGAPFNELFTMNGPLDAGTHTISLYVVASSTSDIYLVAAEFE